ncbi:unnamed protein product [Caenorhabditis bovis]|uniref:RNase H type-1 domain-containing protein n=1 Tax=Caenorhabditis bovis TaxID=2654633 RepID=A0A8S1FAZ0_9PELO|nr:unnamed protein product [Caenorhabditis bovis]
MFSRFLLHCVPSTSKILVERCLQFSTGASRKAEINDSEFGENKFCEVSTTGYDFKTANGKRRGKYAVYWGPKDSRNTLQTLPEGTNFMTAIYHSLLDAVITARETDPPPPLLIYTDLKNEKFLSNLSIWAKRDFYKYNKAEKLDNADILKDLHSAIQRMDIKLVHRPASGTGTPNYVISAIYQNRMKRETEENSKKSKYCSAKSEEEPHEESGVAENEERDKNGRISSESVSKSWPRVYVGAICKEKKEFFSAGYCTIWPNGEAGGGCARRFAPFPITYFRAILAGIEEALKEAVENRLQRVVVVTTCGHFIKLWKHRWIGPSGNYYPSREFFDRINDLCEQIQYVHFRYEKERDEREIFKELHKKSYEGLSYALIGKDRSEYELDLNDLTISSQNLDKNIPMVRLFKTGTDLNAGFVWDDGEAPATNAVGIPQAIILIMEQAISMKMSSIVVRTDNSKLIRSFEAHLEVWKRNGWRNSLHKRIQRKELWERAYELKQNVKVYWELMATVTDDDVERNRTIPEFRKQL